MIIDHLPIRKKLKRQAFFFFKGYAARKLRVFTAYWFPQDIQMAYNSSIEKARSKSFVTIANHVCDFDWLFMDLFAEEFGFSKYAFAAIKASLRSVFIVGYFLEKFGSVFLERKSMPEGKKLLFDGKTDLQRLQEKSLEIQEDGYPVNPMIFPEGTYIEAETVEFTMKLLPILKEKNKNIDFPALTHTLIPKINGFKALLLSQPNFSESICDVTLFVNPYARDFPRAYPITKLLLSGRNSVHINLLAKYIQLPIPIQRLIFEIKNANPAEKNVMDELDAKFSMECSTFLNDLFKEKERLLILYEKQGSDKSFNEFLKENLKDYYQDGVQCTKGNFKPIFFYFLPSVFFYLLISMLVLSKLSCFDFLLSALNDSIAFKSFLPAYNPFRFFLQKEANPIVI